MYYEPKDYRQLYYARYYVPEQREEKFRGLKKAVALLLIFAFIGAIIYFSFPILFKQTFEEFFRGERKEAFSLKANCSASSITVIIKNEGALIEAGSWNLIVRSEEKMIAQRIFEVGAIEKGKEVELAMEVELGKGEYTIYVELLGKELRASEKCVI